MIFRNSAGERCDKNINTRSCSGKTNKRYTVFIVSLSFLLLLLVSLGGCDSEPVMSNEELYNSAIVLMEEGKYEDAIAVFDSLDGYKDSNDRIETCRSAITEQEYTKALELMETWKYSEALALFETLEGYEDSNARIEECKYYLSFIFALNDAQNGYSIIGYSGSFDALVIPSEYKGLPVTEIGYNAFIKRESIVSVSIPDTVISIGKHAFANCTFLESVELSENISVIGDCAFYNCEALSNITLPNGITELGASSFEGCSALEIAYIGIEDEWEKVSKGTSWGSLNDNNGNFSQVPVVFKPVCDGINHYVVINFAIAPTCDETGLSEGSHCQVCDEVLVSQVVIDTLGHDTVYHEAKAAGCTEIGWNDYETCARCDYSTYAELAPLGHNIIGHEGKAATCTDLGWDDYETCTRCDYSTYAEIGVLGHDLETHDAKAATCTDAGWDTYVTCSRCEYSTYSEIHALTHDITEYEAKSATCLSVGWEAYEACSVCDYTTYVEIAALGHDITEHGAQSATCISVGWDAYEICSRCDYSTCVEIPIDSEAHDINKENTCTFCHKYFDEGVIFVLSEDETYYVVADYTGDAESVIIPSQYMGIDVTTIADSAFADCATVKKVVITENITNIGENAFSGCTSLISVKYTGSEERWTNIEISEIGNEIFGSIGIIFEYDFNDVADEVVFHFISVGQADAILVTTPWGNMLIDTGDHVSSSQKLLADYLESQNISDIDYLVLSHPHADHIGSADKVILNYNVKNVIMPDFEMTSAVYNRLIAAIAEKDVNVVLIGQGEDCEEYGYTFELGMLKNTILGPTTSYSDANNISIVVKSEFGDTSVLFTGDAESKSEADMLALYKNGELDCDILKVGHHGSNTSTTEAFLAAVSPDIAVISCGAGNKYNHPNLETIQKLEDAGVEYYRTDTDGDVLIKTDGKTVEILMPSAVDEAA